MNRKAMKSSSNAVENKLVFKRQTIRNLNADEAREIRGGKICAPATCNTVTCGPESGCTTISVP
jgi:hypothetical protein